jgi:serine/threonine-protein kinase
VLHQVGVGTLGPVFRTYEPTRDRLVAVKVFRLDITPEQAQALADELSKPAEAGLFHPSIVEPIAAGVEGSSAYRADEYVAAETLDVAMRHYAPAPIEKILPFITQLAGALDFARSAGIGHGALHPRDIFVTPEEARAGGFGVVEALERVGLRAPVRRPYTAPERIGGSAWSASADVFSLAVISYELLTGRRPSGTGSQIAPLTGTASAAAVHSVLVRAMSEDPARRYPSALAFASALDAAATGQVSEVDVAAAPVPEDVDDAVADMPPPAVVSARAEPVEADLEETEFRASEPDLDEFAAEQYEDAPQAAPPRSERRTSPPGVITGRSLFDHEADEHLAIDRDRDTDRETERFADEFAAASDASDDETGAPPRMDTRRVTAPIVPPDDDVEAIPYAGPAPLSGYGEEPIVVHDRSGLGIVPVAITVVLALLVGFAAGYSVGGRAPAAPSSEAAAEAPPQQPAAQPQPAAPKPYSEQAVTPAPAEPPPTVSEVPTAGADAPAAAPTSAKPEPEKKITTGTVDVRSTPPGAGVTVDGRWRGRTPLTIPDLSLGTHTVRVVQPGFETEREEVILSSSTPSRALSYRLERTAPPPTRAPARPTTAPPRPTTARTPPASQRYSGTIYVDSRPRGARVLVDGKFLGTTPVRIPDIAIGSHVVRLQLDDHRDWTTSTRVSAAQETRVTGSLERIR